MMNSSINTDNVSASVEIPTLDATLSANTLIGQSNANSLTGNTTANTLIGSIGNGVIVSGIRSIYVNSIEQTVIGDTAYISLSYNILTDKPTIPTKTSDLINDSGFINSGYVTTNEFTSLSNQVGIIENNITNVNNDIEEIENNIDEINETLTSKVNQTDFNNLQTQVTTNSNNISANTSNIATNTSNITTLTNIVDAQAQTLTSATAQIEDNSDDIETLQTDVSSINTALNNKVDTSTFNVLDAQVQTNTTAIAGKQDTLVSGTNIKTINNNSLLGSGNITISGGQATDVQINGTSITSNNTANIETNSTYDATTNKIATMNDLPVIPTIPTKTSDLTNDSGYITNTDYASTGSSTGGVIQLRTAYNTDTNASGVLYCFNRTYAQYLNNDNSAFISKGTLENVITGMGLVSMSTLSVVATTGDYNDLNNLPSIPTATSDLTNDSGFITSSDLPTDTGWHNLTLESGVSTGSIGGTPQCRRIGKMVYIRGGVAFTATSGRALATIPAGYRPATQMYKIACTGGTRYSRMYVTAGGTIGYDWILNANGTSVTSGSIGWYDINISYLID